MLKQIQKIVILSTLALSIVGGFFAVQKDSALAAAGINKQINFQGKVVNTDGTNVTNGSYNFNFKIYTVSSGGVAVWSELNKSLTVTDGIFQTNLGDATALPGSVDFNTDNIYLGVEFNANGEMTPRVQFTASPYALNADLLDGKDWNNPGTIGTSATTLALASGGTSAWTNTAGNLTVSTVTSGTLALTSAGALNLSAAAASTVALANTTDALNFDSNTLSIDALNNRVGIGTISPSSRLYVYSATEADNISIDGTTNPAMVLRSGGFIKGYSPIVVTANGSFFSDSLIGDMGFRSESNRILFGQGSGASTMNVYGNKVGIGAASPTAFLDIKAPTTLAASLRLEASSAVDPSAPNIGDLWFNGTNLYFRKDGSTSQDLLTAGSGMSNPMTTAGDIIYGGSSGVPTRLGEGTNDGYVLKINTATHVPYWAAGGSSGPFTDGTGITYLTDTAEDFAVGGSVLASPFSVDTSLNTARIGSGATNNGILNMYASNAATGSLEYTTNDAWYFNGGRVGVGTNNATAFIDITAPTAGAASLRLEASAAVNPSAPNIGDLWFNGTNLYFRKDGSTSKDLLAGGGSGISLATGTADVASNANSAIFVNETSTGNLLQLQKSGVDKFLVANNGGLTINGSDSSIVRQTASDFALGTIGSSLENANGALSLADTVSGGIPNSGKGAITTGSQPTTSAAIGAGAFSITRADGKYMVIRGGGTGIDIYDSTAETFTSSALVLNGATGVGAIALPRPGGLYRVLTGGGLLTSSLVDPMESITVGVSVAVAAKGAGTVAFLRPDGRYLVTNAPTLATTQIYDPIGDAFVTGPSGSGGNWAAGAVVLPRNDGQALIVVGGASSNTQLYDPSAGIITGVSPIGAFTAGPSLDGKAAAGTCATTTSGSVAFKRQDGKYVILSKVNVWAVYDPTANNMDCNTSGGPATAIGDGGHAIPLQDGKFLVLVGGGSTNSYIYNPSDDSFTSQGTALTAVNTGAHSIMEVNGKWRIINGNGTATNLYDTGLPMSDTTTKYVSEDIFNSAINPNSSFWWRAQIESAYTGVRNGATNTAFSPLQFTVKSAVSSDGGQAGCATPLDNATAQEIMNSGDLIRAASGNNCVRVTVQYNRPLPKRLFDERGVWVGNGMVVTRFDEITPRLYNFKIDNAAVLKRSNFDFAASNTSNPTNPTVPAAPTSAAPGGSGSCTSGNHYWFVTFVTDGVESALSPASVVRSCSGANQEVLNPIPLGPTGTTARKIYRTVAAGVATDTPFLVGSPVADNTTTTFTDNFTDASLGAPYVSVVDNSGPIMSRSETRVETVNGNLVLPYGRITPTTQVPTTTGYYLGMFSSAHPKLTNPTSMGTTVIARDDKTFIVLESGGQFAELYDPATETFTNQTGAGNVPTGSIGAGAFALKRADGNFLVYLGTGATTTVCATAGTATNIYDQNQASGSRFTNGPCLQGTGGGIGAQAILNNDGTYTIIHGNATTTTSIYNQMTNTMMVGPITTTAVNCGAWAIPMGLPNNNQYKVKAGVAAGGTAVGSGTMNYDANSKVFSAAPNLAAITGCGSIAFQRPDGYWLITEGETGGVTGLVTSIMNPINGTTAAGPLMVTTGAGRGSHVIPRADGTFLIVSGNPVVNGNSLVSQIYFPTGGTAANALGVPAGTFSASTFGPSLMAGAPPAVLTVGVATAGGAVDAGIHGYKFTNVTNGVESLASTNVNSAAIVGGTQTVPLSVIAAGPTGTTARKIYRTAAGAQATGPWKLLATINDNTTLIYSDIIADAALGTTYAPGGPGDGSLSFQRPDGKFVTIFGGSTASTATNLYDAGWFPDGQYMSEMMPVPSLSANATLEWQKTSDAYVRFEARVAGSKKELGATSFHGVDSPGSSINNAGGETWAQIEINFRRDFPTFCGNLSGVYLSGAGMNYCSRDISLPTVKQYQITNGQDLLSLQTNSYNVLRVTSNGGIYSSQQGGFFAGGADLAENYTSRETLEKGEIVSVDASDNHNVKRSQMAYQKDVLGVVSTTPGFVAGAYTENSYPIALVGRVPVNVSTENGMIKAGDRITAASIPGYGMRATVAGRVVGTALESMDLAKLGTCPVGGQGGVNTKCGQIMVFVNLADYEGMPIETLLSEAKNAGLNVPGDENFASFNSQMQVLNFLQTLKENQATANSSDILTKNINATGEIISPMIITDTLVAKHIKAGTIEGLEIYEKGIQEAQSSADTNAVEVKTLGQRVTDLEGMFKASEEKTTSTDAPKEDSVLEKVMTFMSNVIFRGKVSFEKVPTFSSDTAGYAVIKSGQQRVAISFDEEYVSKPVVNASLILGEYENEEVRRAAEELLLVSDVKFIITNVTTKGFEVRINQEALSDINFSWQSLAVKNAKKFESKEEKVVSETVVGSEIVPAIVSVPTVVTPVAEVPAITPIVTADEKTVDGAPDKILENQDLIIEKGETTPPEAITQ